MSTAEILLVDSNKTERNRLEALLTENGFTVETAETLERARELADKGPRELLLASLLLEDGNTFDFLTEWTEKGQSAVALTDVYTGSTVCDLLTEQIGVKTFLEHPIDDGLLLGHVRSFFPGREEVVDEPDEPTPAGDVVELAGFIPRQLDQALVPQSGTFGETDILAVITHLVIEGANGALMLQCEQTKKLLYFQQGIPVGIKSNRIEEFLGQMLAQEGLITPEDCTQSLSEMAHLQRRQGEVLIMMGCITPEILDSAMHRQFMYKLQDVFNWTEGSFRYKDSAVPTAYATLPMYDAASLLWEAVQSSRPSDRVRTVLDPLINCPVAWTGLGMDTTHLAVVPEAGSIFEGMTGAYTTTELLNSAPNPELAMLLLYTLTAFGAVTFQNRPPNGELY